jgi:hypothetical protein
VAVKPRNPVFPDIQYALLRLELAGLRRRQARGESIQGVAVTVELGVPRTDPGKRCIVLLNEPVGITLYRGSACFQAAAT